MNNQDNKQPEDIFKDIGQKPIDKLFIEKIPKDEQLLSEKLPTVTKKRKGFNIFLLITRLLIILAIIIAIAFGILYFWDKLENENILIENEISIELANNVTSTPSIIIEEPKEKPLDTDADGLTDVEEKQLKTDINNSDTDNDGLSDRLEVKVYFTNPLDSDTDNDGMTDGEEVRRGLDPDNPVPGAKLFDLKTEINRLK